MAPSVSVRQLWRSWWHGQRASAPARAAGLGVEGLPHGVGHLPVGVPAALLAHDEALWASWCVALVTDLLAAGPVLVLAPRSEDIETLMRVPALQQAAQAGRLRPWVLPAAAQQRLQGDGLAAFAQELGRIGLRPDTGLCLLDASALLAGATVAQQQRLGTQLRRFAAMRRLPVALVFALQRAAREGASDVGAAVRAQGATFGHVAELALASGRPVLTLQRWDGDHGAVHNARYELRAAGVPGSLRYDGSFSVGAVPVLAEAPDQFAVYATQAVVERQRGVPATWHVAPTLTALEEQVRGASGATVVLDAGLPGQFEDVAALVHRLRRTHPPGLKIIVRETQAKLRAPSEQALLRLGATAVVYRETGFSRLLQLIEDSRHQVHTRPVESDYEQALAEFLPARARGYQPPTQFVPLVRDMLQRTEGAGLVHCLVQLPLLPSAAHLDALLACRAQRDGDLVTADAQGLYVFLFACRESDLDMALAHLFLLPLGQLFSSQMADTTPAGMALMLEYLDERAAGLPDYTPSLGALQPLQRPAPSTAPQPPTSPASMPVSMPALTPVPDQPAGPSLMQQAVHVRPCPIGRRPAAPGGPA